MGSEGILQVHTGYLADLKLLRDSSWSPGQTGSKWVDVSSAGEGTPEPMKDLKSHGGNILIAKDLIRAIEEDREPLGGIWHARAATEMIVAVFESHRQGGPVKFPLENRNNPLTML